MPSVWMPRAVLSTPSYFRGPTEFQISSHPRHLKTTVHTGKVYQPSQQTPTGSIHGRLKLTTFTNERRSKTNPPLRLASQLSKSFPVTRILQLPLMAASGLFQDHT